MIIFKKLFWYLSTLIVLMLTVVACFFLSDIQLNTRFEDFFPKKSTQWKIYHSYNSFFGDDKNTLYIVFYHEKSVFDTQFIQRIAQLSDSLHTLHPTQKTLSPTSISLPRPTPFGTFFSPLLSENDVQRLRSDSIRLSRLPLLHDLFLSSDNSAILLSLTYRSGLSEAVYYEYFNTIEKLLEDFRLKGALLGNGYLEMAYKQLLQKETGRAALLSFGLIILALVFLFRNGILVLLSTLTVFLSLVLFYGSLGFFHWQIGILGNLFPTIILVLGISDSIHFLHHYGQQLRAGLKVEDAIRQTLKLKGMALFYTSFTTFVGFITLSFSSMPALQQFGWQAGFGVLLAFVVTLLILPGILAFYQIQAVFLKPQQRHYWYKPFYKTFRHFFNHPQRTILLVVSLMVFTGWGIYHIDTNNSLITSIPKKAGIQADYRQFEEKFGGYRTLEWLLECKNGYTLLQKSILEQIGLVDQYLGQHSELSMITSPYAYFESLTRIMKPGQAYAIPDSSHQIAELDDRTRRFVSGYRAIFLDSTNTRGRISARIRDIGRIETDKIRTDIQQWIESQSFQNIEMTPTGRDLLIDEGHKVRIAGMFSNLLLAVFVVVALLGIIFKSWRIALIALMANLFPLLLVAGFMGYLGIELRGTTTIIFIVGFVVAVDDTIHFLSAFWRHYHVMHDSVDSALRSTFAETGQAIIWTSFTLAGGFMILMTSAFWDIWAHGLLISLMLLFALLMDLILLPLLLKIFLTDD